MTAGTEGTPEFRIADVAADKARLEYERAFARFLDDGEPQSLMEAQGNYRQWRDLQQLKMEVAYFQHYRMHSHAPGAP